MRVEAPPPAEDVVVVSHTEANGRVLARTRNARGFTMGIGGLVGHTPKGFAVWVNPRAPHRATLARHTRATVAQWRRLGINARYRGFGTPKVVEGVITMTANRTGCSGGRAGYATQTWSQLREGQYYLKHAEAVICPRVLGSMAPWHGIATIRHELGHAAGLGHFDQVFRGRPQVMRSRNTPGVTAFGAGDLAGLRWLAGNNARVRSMIAPTGRLTGTSWGSDSITVSGWSKLQYYPARGLRIVATRNGTVVRTVMSNPKAGGRFSVSVPLPAGAHEVCVTAVSPVNRFTRKDLGCVMVSS